MIDKLQLKELGWSKELIDEVTRISGEIKKIADLSPHIEGLNIVSVSKSGNSINTNNIQSNTGNSILYD